MSQYLLAEHVFLRPIGQDVIVLDVRNDRYLAFSRSVFDAANDKIFGWSADGESASASTLARSDCESALSQLMQFGLLTADARAGKRVAAIVAAAPCASIVDDFCPTPATVNALAGLRFIRAATTAAYRLRRWQFRDIVAGIRARGPAAEATATERAQLHHLASVFRRLRPMLFASFDHCLFESYALMLFLLLHKLRPTWTFGVTTSPFVAHCWVQYGDLALNDSLDSVRRYEPIMMI